MIDNFFTENVEKEKKCILMKAQYKISILGPFVALFIYTRKKKEVLTYKGT